MGEPLRREPLYLSSLFCPTISKKQLDNTLPIFPNSIWVLASEGEFVGSGGSEDKNELVPPSPMRALWTPCPVKGQVASQVTAPFLRGCLKKPQG
jgi:hypothetical protein